MSSGERFVTPIIQFIRTTWCHYSKREAAYAGPLSFVAEVEETPNTVFSIHEIMILYESKSRCYVSIR